MERSWPQHADNIIIKSIMNAADMVETFVWADFGTCEERILTITYTSPTFAGRSVVKTFNWVLVGTSYKLDTIVWNVL